MKTKKVKKRIRLAVLIVITLTLTTVWLFSCVVDADMRYNGFSRGFHYEYRGSWLIRVAARSRETVFDINDVTMEFSYGWYEINVEYCRTLPQRHALYFVSSIYSNDVFGRQLSAFDAPENIENAFFIKEIANKDFLTADYEFKITRLGGKKFNHSERITVPKEIFAESYQYGRGEFYFMLAEIQPLEPITEDSLLCAPLTPRVRISYDFVDENTIQLRTK